MVWRVAVKALRIGPHEDTKVLWQSTRVCGLMLNTHYGHRQTTVSNFITLLNVGRSFDFETACCQDQYNLS